MPWSSPESAALRSIVAVALLLVAAPVPAAAPPPSPPHGPQPGSGASLLEHVSGRHTGAGDDPLVEPSKAYRDLVMKDSGESLGRATAAEMAAKRSVADDSQEVDDDELEREGLGVLKHREAMLENSIALVSEAWHETQAAFQRLSDREKDMEREEELERKTRVRLEYLMGGDGDDDSAKATQPPHKETPLVRRAPRSAASQRTAEVADGEAASDHGSNLLRDASGQDGRRGDVSSDSLPAADHMDDWPRMRQQTRSHRPRVSHLEEAPREDELRSLHHPKEAVLDGETRPLHHAEEDVLDGETRPLHHAKEAVLDDEIRALHHAKEAVLDGETGPLQHAKEAVWDGEARPLHHAKEAVLDDEIRALHHAKEDFAEGHRQHRHHHHQRHGHEAREEPRQVHRRPARKGRRRAAATDAGPDAVES